MPTRRLLQDEVTTGDAIALVLEQVGIDAVFGLSGGHTGYIFTALSKYQNSIRTILVREESLAGVMAEVYGRLTGRPGVVLGQGPWVLGNGLIGTIEALPRLYETAPYLPPRLPPVDEPRIAAAAAIAGAARRVLIAGTVCGSGKRLSRSGRSQRPPGCRL